MGPQRDVSWPRAIFLSAGYLVLFVLLDRLSFIHALQHTEVSPWGPNIALLIAVVMRFGPRVAPLTIIVPGISEFVLRGSAPHGVAALGSVICIGCTYTTAGLLLRRRQTQFVHPTTRWLAVLLAVIISSALLNALLYSAVLTYTGDLSAGSYFAAVRIDWVGDMNAIIILLPLVLILQSGNADKLIEYRDHAGRLALQAAVLVCVFVLTFARSLGFEDTASQMPFYLMFLPIIWIALRWGATITAVALAAVQIGIVAFVAQHNTPESFLAIQVLMVVLAGTGLFMGIATSENERFGMLMRSKDDELSGLNARMAVSELNSAIGHELNNPLAALLNYLRSASLILESPSLDRELLRSTIDKSLGEATRSVNVVRKLRDFFRWGIVQRQALDPKKLAADALGAVQVKFRGSRVVAALEAAADLPPILADPLQLSMVLQNLLANAYDAAGNSTSRRAKVSVSVMRSEGDVVFSIEDSGTGIPEQLRDQIFRPLVSTKSAGMGLGLAICRSLVEANEGRIWVRQSGADGTCMAFSIPVSAKVSEEKA